MYGGEQSLCLSICAWHKKFMKTGIVLDKGRSGQPKTSDENFDHVFLHDYNRCFPQMFWFNLTIQFKDFIGTVQSQRNIILISVFCWNNNARYWQLRSKFKDKLFTPFDLRRPENENI